jgi:hypothetical protein
MRQDQVVATIDFLLIVAAAAEAFWLFVVQNSVLQQRFESWGLDSVRYLFNLPRPVEPELDLDVRVKFQVPGDRVELHGVYLEKHQPVPSHDPDILCIYHGEFAGIERVGLIDRCVDLEFRSVPPWLARNRLGQGVCCSSSGGGERS